MHACLYVHIGLDLNPVHFFALAVVSLVVLIGAAHYVAELSLLF